MYHIINVLWRHIKGTRDSCGHMGDIVRTVGGAVENVKCDVEFLDAKSLLDELNRQESQGDVLTVKMG